MSYEKLVESQGVEIINSLHMGSRYEGDIVMVVRNSNGQFGILTTGYGSCSGCDALLRCYDDPEKEEQLARGLCNGVIWYEPEDIIDHLRDKDWEGSYYGRTEGLHEFIDSVSSEIMIRYLGGF